MLSLMLLMIAVEKMMTEILLLCRNCRCWPFDAWLSMSAQLAFYVNLYRAVIGPSATLTGRWRPDIDLRRMLTGCDRVNRGHVCGFLERWLQIANEQRIFALFLGSVFDYMCFTVAFHRWGGRPLCGPNIYLQSGVASEIRVKFRASKNSLSPYPLLPLQGGCSYSLCVDGFICGVCFTHW